MSIVALAALFCGAYTIQTAIGFGAMVVVVSLGAQWIPIDALLPQVVPEVCVGAAAVTWIDRRHLAWDFLLRRVFPCMVPGALVGVWLLQVVDISVLKRVYGALVVVLAVVSLYAMRRSDAAEPDDAPDAAASKPGAGGRGSMAWVASAGVVHGLFASGGPLLVYAAQRLNLQKQAFRGTLSVVWFTINLGLCVAYASTGRLSADELCSAALLLPALGLALLLGNWIHHRLDLRRLRMGVLSMLLVAGSLLVI